MSGGWAGHTGVRPDPVNDAQPWIALRAHCLTATPCRDGSQMGPCEWRGRAGRPEELPREMLKAPLEPGLGGRSTMLPGLPRTWACRRLPWDRVHGARAGPGFQGGRTTQAPAEHGLCVPGLTVGARRRACSWRRPTILAGTRPVSPGAPGWGGRWIPAGFWGSPFSQGSPTPF